MNSKDNKQLKNFLDKKTIFHRALKTIHRLSKIRRIEKLSRLRPIHRSSTDGIFMNGASTMDHGLWALETWPIPIFFNRKGKISGREVAPMKSPARQTRHKIRPIVFPQSSGGMVSTAKRPTFPRHVEIQRQFSNFRCPPNEYSGTFDGLKRILKHFFFPPSLQLKLIPSGNRSIQILPIRVTNHEPFFLSSFLFLLPPRSYFTGKNKVEQGRGRDGRQPFPFPC